MRPAVSNELQTLRFALEKYPEKVEIAPIHGLVMDSARQNSKRPAFVKLAVPDELVKSLRGSRETTDIVLLVRLPREIEDRAESPIILPGEVG